MPAVDQAYMLDTNIFNALLKRDISAAVFAGRRLLVIGVQADELNATRDTQKREKLLNVFEEVNPKVVLASSFAFGIEGAGFGQAEWNDGSGLFEKMRDRLRQLDKESGKKNKDPLKQALNQERDILIAETAIKNHATLVSGDENLRKVVSEFGGHAITINQFESETTPPESESAAITRA
jgi:predicted nucleic acid-binding protein